MEERRHGQDEPVTRAECQYAKGICYQNNIKPIMDKIEKLDDKIGALSELVAALPERILEKTDKKYAGKTTEKAVYAMIGAVVLFFLNRLFGLI